MKRLILSALGIAILAIGISTALPVQTQPQPASAQQASDKFDGECTGHETAGRCADKCPADTSEGAYHLQGYDKETGAAVCGFSYYNECPYASAHSATDDVCLKLKAQYEQSNPAPETAAEFQGK